MADAHGLASADRDLRLDFFRGLALFCIFIDHIPNNVLASFTLQAVGWSDAAEVFILISGYAAGMVYGRVCDRQGYAVGAVRIYHRVWQLYVAHVFLFMIFMATVAHTVGALNSAIYAEEFRAADFLKEPDVAIIKALTLQFQPSYMDILPLYIVLLAALPFVLAGFTRAPGPVLAASALLWLSVQFFQGVALPAYPGPDHEWFFNPFAWQFLFFTGAWFGWRGTTGGIAWLDSRWTLRAAAAFAAAAFLFASNWNLHNHFDRVPPLMPDFFWPLLSKTDLGPLRLLNVLALALLVARLIKPQAGFLSRGWARPFLVCGRHSLHVFCLGILLSVIGHLLLNEYFGGVVLQIAVSAAGIAIMVGIAVLIDWFEASRRGDRTARPLPVRAGGGA